MNLIKSLVFRIHYDDFPICIRRSDMTSYPIEEALKAQKALRNAAGLGDEMFPIQAFAGMISDEVEALRNRGKAMTRSRS